MVTLLRFRYQISLILADIKITINEFQYEVNPEGATVNFSDVKGVFFLYITV